MKRRAFYRLAAAWALGVMLSVPRMANAEGTDMDTGISSSTTPSLCLDGMETVPIEDDLMPTEVSVDGGCMLSESPISI